MRVNGLDRVIIMVQDLDRTIEFFSTKLGIEIIELLDTEADGQRAGICLNHQIELIQPVLPLSEDTPSYFRRWVDQLENKESVLVALSFRVDDVDKTAVEADKQQLRILDELNLAEMPPLPIHNFGEIFLDEVDTLSIPITLTAYSKG
jgi:catechol 2,3-dioxygenase-like lactoylglutathione lyase family enzyme